MREKYENVRQREVDIEGDREAHRVEQSLKPLICYTLNSFMINYTVHQVDHQRSVQQCVLFRLSERFKHLLLEKGYK